MPQLILLPALYLANTLWFLLAFLQFSFRPHHAMTTGSLRLHSKDPRIQSIPSGDAWHHDLLAYLGGMNLAPAALAAIRLAVLTAPNIPGLSAFTTGTSASDRPMDGMALVILGVANFSQARVNLCVVRDSGRWIMGEVSESITVIDGVLTVLDWSAAIATTRNV